MLVVGVVALHGGGLGAARHAVAQGPPPYPSDAEMLPRARHITYGPLSTDAADEVHHVWLAVQPCDVLTLALMHQAARGQLDVFGPDGRWLAGVAGRSPEGPRLVKSLTVPGNAYALRVEVRPAAPQSLAGPPSDAAGTTLRVFNSSVGATEAGLRRWLANGQQVVDRLVMRRRWRMRPQPQPTRVAQHQGLARVAFATVPLAFSPDVGAVHVPIQARAGDLLRLGLTGDADPHLRVLDADGRTIAVSDDSDWILPRIDAVAVPDDRGVVVVAGTTPVPTCGTVAQPGTLTLRVENLSVSVSGNIPRAQRRPTTFAATLPGEVSVTLLPGVPFAVAFDVARGQRFLVHVVTEDSAEQVVEMHWGAGASTSRNLHTTRVGNTMFSGPYLSGEPGPRQLDVQDPQRQRRGSLRVGLSLVEAFTLRPGHVFATRVGPPGAARAYVLNIPTMAGRFTLVDVVVDAPQPSHAELAFSNSAIPLPPTSGPGGGGPVRYDNIQLNAYSDLRLLVYVADDAPVGAPIRVAVTRVTPPALEDGAITFDVRGEAGTATATFEAVAGQPVRLTLHGPAHIPDPARIPTLSMLVHDATARWGTPIRSIYLSHPTDALAQTYTPRTSGLHIVQVMWETGQAEGLQLSLERLSAP